VSVLFDVPVLGICLGAQQLARDRRRLSPRAPERGGCRLVTGDDELFPDARARHCVHVDSFEVPPNDGLHERDGGQQAFRLGRRAWGVRFIRVDDDLLEHWLDAPTRGSVFGKHLRG
jgi:GMP synthase-like glutamine amidotransferase